MPKFGKHQSNPVIFSTLEVSVKYSTFFGGLYYENGNATTLSLGGRTLMLVDTRGVSSGFFAVGSTVTINTPMPGLVGIDETDYYTSIFWLYVKKYI